MQEEMNSTGNGDQANVPAITHPTPPHPAPAQNNHSFPAGIKCFTDATIATDPQRYRPRRAGLGVFIHDSTATLQHGILIQAVAPNAEDALQAETQALHLASSIITKLQLQGV